jgi:hypothetical protein
MSTCSGYPRLTLILQQSEVEEIGSGYDNNHLSEMLQSQSIRFRDCLIKAIVIHCQQREDVPSLDEIARIYSIPTGGDPLRKLMADVYICKGKVSITNIPHAEFQRELNAGLAGHIAEMQDYIKQVRGSKFKRGIEPPEPLQIDAARYISSSRNRVSNWDPYDSM